MMFFLQKWHLQQWPSPPLTTARTWPSSSSPCTECSHRPHQLMQIAPAGPSFTRRLVLTSSSQSAPAEHHGHNCSFNKQRHCSTAMQTASCHQLQAHTIAPALAIFLQQQAIPVHPADLGSPQQFMAVCLPVPARPACPRPLHTMQRLPTSS